jgi:hypothetical protein
MEKLPIGIQSFEKLRNNGCLYVDKTEHIYRMVTEGSVYFLSRPRRFGKSLLVSTLEALFGGKKKLFEGLYIYDKWDWSQQYPVIRIDWTLVNHSSVDNMESSLCRNLNEIAQQYNVKPKAKTATDCFDELIKLLYKKSGKKGVVVLIDEYDKPVTSHLFDTDLNDIQKTVHDFYQVMKGADEYLKFIFLTGVSKFSGLSVFSALNNLYDITLSEPFVSICGYTQEELESNFSEHINRTAEYLKMTGEYLLERIRYRYNGYSWDGKTAVYNPFSTLNFFAEQRFGSYWYNTGTPTFLIEIIKRRDRTSDVLAPMVVNDSIFRGYNPEDLDEAPLLFQTGYLTIKRIELRGGIPRYTLDIPNAEVREAFLESFLKSYGQYRADRIVELHTGMQQQIASCNEVGFARTLEMMVATVPANLHIARESYYHSLMLLWMRLIGFEIRGEEPNNLGRADIVWEQSEISVVAEIKYHARKKIDALLAEAMAQIHERRYYNRYNGKILLLGIAFSGKNIGCRMEIMIR